MSGRLCRSLCTRISGGSYQCKSSKPSHVISTNHTKYGHNVVHHPTNRHFNSNSTDFPDTLPNLIQIEKLVDSPVTFLSIEYLQNNEIFYLMENIQKLIGTKHPIVEFGAQTLLGSTGTFKVQGLIALLLAQILNASSHSTLLLRDHTGILPKQRRLVEVCEMISTAFFLHDNIVSLNKVEIDARPNIQKGNKLSLLFGDYFLATACSQLATMENPSVVNSVSRAIAHNVEGRFWLETIDSSAPPTLDDLLNYCSLRHGALLSSCCYSAALLSGLNIDTALSLQKFGDYVGQAIHLKSEIFAMETSNIGSESLSSYPYIAAVRYLHEQGKIDLIDPISGLNEEKVKKIINLGYGLDLTAEQCEVYCNKALESLKQLNSNDKLTQNLAKVVMDIKSAKPVYTA